MPDDRMNTNLDPADFDGRLKDLERRVHTLEDDRDNLQHRLAAMSSEGVPIASTDDKAATRKR